MLTKDQVQEVNKRLSDPKRYAAVNSIFHKRRGSRFVNRLKVFANWIWKYREEIFQALGFILMFADDGTPILKDADEDVKIETETVHGVKETVEVPDTTPSGEEVEDFVDDETEEADAKSVDEGTDADEDQEETGGRKPDDVYPLGRKSSGNASAVPGTTDV